MLKSKGVCLEGQMLDLSARGFRDSVPKEKDQAVKICFQVCIILYEER